MKKIIIKRKGRSDKPKKETNSNALPLLPLSSQLSSKIGMREGVKKER